MDYEQLIQDMNYLEHHGIKNMHWGIRRYQNADGSLTEEGKLRYGIKEAKIKAKAEKAIAKTELKTAKIAAKAEKAAAKNLRKSAKDQEKILKLEMKKIKKMSAYEKGRKFGEKFALSFGDKFGEQLGEGIGKTLGNWQKWKELKNTKYSNETARMLAELKKAAYDDDNVDALNALKDSKK